MREFNYSSLKNKTWDNEIIGLVAKIHEYKGRQELYLKQKPEVLEKLVEVAKAQSTEASNEIEGIVTTRARFNKLINDKTTPRNRDEKEILGYRDVLNIIHESFENIPISSNYILQLHRDLFQYTNVSFGGKYKNTQNAIVATDAEGKEVTLFTPMSPFETPEAIEAICESFNKVIATEEVEPLILIPIFIHDFLCIHPFNDGNGRMSRLLTTLLLYRSGFVVGRYISLENKIAKNKKLYYEALEDCQIGWYENEEDASEFIKYILGIIIAAYRDFEDRVELISDKLPAIELVRRTVNNTIGSFKKADIMERCPSIGSSSIESSLKTMCEAGEIEKRGSRRSTYYVRLK